MFKYLVAVLCSYYVIGVFCQDLDFPVSQSCLGCICEAISGCNTTLFCPGNVCGAFRITWPYWVDANKPTVNEESANETLAFNKCGADLYCSAITVQGYMNKFKQDCNGDGKIDCDDYVAIHKLGGYGCTTVLPENYAQRYAQCKQLVGNLQD